MARFSGHKFKFLGNLECKDGNLSFHALGHPIALLPYVAKKITDKFESTPAEIGFTAEFSTKLNKSSGFHEVKIKKDSDILFSELTLSLPEMPNVSLEKVNCFNPNSETLKELMKDVINVAIQNGRFSEIFENERSPWTEEEELTALSIYIATRHMSYGELTALIKEKILNNAINRSEDSVEMKVNTYKSLDPNSGVKGLESTSDTSKRLWEKYQAGEIILD